MNTERLLLTEMETCQMLNFSRSTLRRLRAEGAIKPVHIRRALRFSASEIERFVSTLHSDDNAQQIRDDSADRTKDA